MSTINSPLRYAGGKFYARSLILEHIPQHISYAEPFAGGGSIFFAKEKVRFNWLNDLDSDLVNVFTFIRDRPQDLIDVLSGEIATKERHLYYKLFFKPSTDLENAARWYYLNRTSYSGIMNIKNCFWGYGEKYSMPPENWGKSILRSSEKLQGVNLTSYDFSTVMEGVADGTFLFIDPPYFNADQDKFYTCSFRKEDHHRLSNLLKKHRHRINFLLTYDDTREVRELYSWVNEIHDKEWNYMITRTDDQKNGKKKEDNHKGERYVGREIFILNFNSTELRQSLPLAPSNHYSSV